MIIVITIRKREDTTKDKDIMMQTLKEVREDMVEFNKK
jgi:hypothetical protein